ncbi:MAG: excinuclease ABC subunit UvrA [Flavobacteriales bacterium]
MATKKKIVIEDDPKQNIIIKGARVHNLKNVTVSIPRNQLTVITGLSGSGKSSLAFDTLFAEGQRRYVESLSSYARQFLGRLDKPDVDTIQGISPAVAIEQKVTSRTSRSTVGTTTEIYDYLKLLFARIGKTISPISGKEVKRDRVEDVVAFILGHGAEDRFMILAPLEKIKPAALPKKLETLAQQGFSRIKVGDKIYKIDEEIKAKASDDLYNIIDRVTADPDEENQTRIADSVHSAFFEGHGECVVESAENQKLHSFSNKFEADGIKFEEPSLNLFSFNNPVGACKTCEGFGSVIGIDENLVIPNKELSLYDDAVMPWRGEKMSEWKNAFILAARKFEFPIHRPYNELTETQKEILWKGNQHAAGLDAFFEFIESESYKIQYRVMLSRYRGKTKCPDCKGTRLRKDANYVKVGGKGISDLVNLPIGECYSFFTKLKLAPQEEKIANRILLEIQNRLKYLTDVGLDYLTLNRLSNSLSGGESQRINLATSLGSSLVGSMYILDEPSIGLHPRDTQRLIGVLKELKNQGNTVIVVEHDEEIMRSSDVLIDMGPEAGSQGGEVVFKGSLEQLLKQGGTLTADYLSGKKKIKIATKRKPGKDKIKISGARENNLKNIDVEIPLRCFTVITGVSGSGKSSLVRDILYPALKKELGGFGDAPGAFDGISGDIKTIKSVEFVDQNPIGKSSRSNPVTYIKAWDEVRTIFASQPLAKQRGYKPTHFSFNVDGGRCEACEGEGYQTIEMQFMADIKLICDACKGKRFKEEVLDIQFKGKNVSDILDLTVDDAVSFFSDDNGSTIHKNLLSKLLPLQQVGLGYIGLGQSSSSLSGGEAQRIKLASFLTMGGNNTHTLFIFDEPTTGLHFHDVQKLMQSFNALLEKGHSIIAIEHNVDVMHSADWIIDLGPDGGDKGGNLVYAGTPEGLKKCKDSFTAKYL